MSIHPENIISFTLALKERHKALTYQPGECVGMVTAQNVGESFTQGVLNSFHKTGSSDAMVRVAHIEALLSVSKNPKEGELNVWKVYYFYCSSTFTYQV